MFKRLFLITLIFLGFVTFAQSETSWIKKKDKSENIEITEKKNASTWIKKKIKKNKKEYKKEIDDSDKLLKSIIAKLEEVDEIKKISEKNEELDLLLGELSNFTRNIQSAVERNCELVENLEEKMIIKLENKNTDFTIKLPKNNIEIQSDDLFKNFFEGHK